jgi:hypothetical protein
MIITFSRTENAIKVLSVPADGSIANRQARESAKNYLNSWLQQQKKFIKLPGFSDRYSKIQKLVNNCR